MTTDPTMPPAAPRRALLALPRLRAKRERVSVLFKGMPRDLPVPILIVQHMPPLFNKLLAERLAAQNGLVLRLRRSASHDGSATTARAVGPVGA